MHFYATPASRITSTFTVFDSAAALVTIIVRDTVRAREAMKCFHQNKTASVHYIERELEHNLADAKKVVTHQNLEHAGRERGLICKGSCSPAYASVYWRQSTWAPAENP